MISSAARRPWGMAAGKVHTVLGDVEPLALGVTMAHEHVLVSLLDWPKARSSASADAPSDPRATEGIALDNVGWVRRNWAGHVDNRRLDEEDVAIRELRLFKDAGGSAIVDATNADLGRDPEALVRVSRATSLHIVAGAGHYIDGAHPLDMDARTEEQLADEIVGDVLEGCAGTNVRAGIIGEIGCSAPMTANERKSLRAAARAQRLTGAALLIHPGRAPDSPLEAMAVVAEAGGDPERTVMSHIDRTLFEPRDMIALARTGCYIEFDLFGQESSYYPMAPIDMPNDATRVDHLQRLIAEGLGHKLLVAQDICHKTGLVTYGGDGYAHIIENVVPLMRRKGMTEAEIDAILVENPACMLTMAPAAG